MRDKHLFYPRTIPFNEELTTIPLYRILERSAKRYPNQKAIICGEIELTYSQLKESCDSFASSLHHRGFRKGDRIGLMLPNSVEYVIGYYAIQRLGGIAVQVSPMYQSSELDYLLRDSEITWLICQENQIKKLERIGLKSELTTIMTDFDKDNENSFYHFIEEGRKELPELDIKPKEDIAVLQYTGGTTGKPKGAMLTHYNLVSNAYQHYLATSLQMNKEILLGNSPVTHVMGMNYLNTIFLVAGTYIVIERFQNDQAIELIKKHKPTIFVGAPTMYISLLQYAKLGKDDLNCLNICTSGSAPLPVEVIREFEIRSGATILEGYGMSECLTTHRNPVANKRKTGSVGIPFPNTECKIVDMETGTKEMPIGVQGELIVKGPQVMKGYWKNKEATKDTLRDGWLHTGDISVMDEDGYFYIVGRKKELIIASGFNIYPIEVEEVLYQHPAVMEACVFGVPDSYRGESVKVVIVRKQNMMLTEEEVIKWCKERLATYKVPRFIEFRDELPKSPAGKILRRKLVEENLSKIGEITS